MQMCYAVLISLACCTLGGETICQLFGLGGWQISAPSAHAAGLGPPNNAFFQVDISDMALKLARRVANSSSAQVTTHQLNNFPG